MSQTTPNQTGTGVGSGEAATGREWRRPLLTLLGDAAELTASGLNTGSPDGETPFSS
jgi:hypothetical protein